MTDPAAVAQAVADAMIAHDSAVHALGIEILSVGPGTARLAMTVRDDMTNGHKTLHGGVSFTLADACFAYACNSYNVPAVAAHCSITYARPAHPGARLIAEARETLLHGRNGIYDVTVTDAQTGEVIAQFRGHSRRLPGKVVDALPALDGGSS